MDRILLDTGPLVAVLSPSDTWHAACVEVWKTLTPPFYTCWPVLTETAWLLRSRPAAVERLLRSAPSGLLRILPLAEEDGPPIASILKRYDNLRPQLADAALVHLARREGFDTVLTLDQRDFRVYRAAGNRAFTILP